MLSKVLQLYNTVKHLKVKQLRYQVQYRLNKPGKLTAYEQGYKVDDVHFLRFVTLPPVYPAAREDGTFIFLNQTATFGEAIDWSLSKYGKLWNYNLQYVNYLLQEDLPLAKRIGWLKSLHAWLREGRLPLEPYPASLRAINTIRLLSARKFQDDSILSALQGELNFLYCRPEFHLLGNHLLENAFALMMGGAFFSNGKWVSKAQQLLQEELEEQVLSDGAHFELSPMYHQIIFFRLLELLDWYSTWKGKDPAFESFLQEKAVKMSSWLQHMTYLNGDIPHFNDSANGISYNSAFLLQYAAELGIVADEALNLSDSGYRKYGFKSYECIVDVAAIGPSYQPGHGHADALSFVMYADKKPLFVEVGTSTYQTDKRRALERSSASHNTVVVNGRNQSQVWSSFRVGSRAQVKIEKDEITQLRASHDGYKNIGVTHTREFIFSEKVVIKDEVQGEEATEIVAYFHIHPDREVQQKGSTIVVDNYISLTFNEALSVNLSPYQMADGYNSYLEGQRVAVRFHDKLITTISFLN
ncbi:alginate lyase family protein [Pontibacter mangrovi]|uniref:Heparinase n=1 Tax=Pontibacter mangrovi TaxID=2589816 RepID=A0A501VV74_9BACT|nr:alginate lyase family protein [Pontibacter mangrovi]TPE39980.1 heparinase [Pontibacter mangrovi]